MLAPLVDRVYVNFDATAKALGGEIAPKVLKVGNPIKPQFASLDYDTARKKLGVTGKYKYFLLSCGGSMGAEKVNFEMLDFMRDYGKIIRSSCISTPPGRSSMRYRRRCSMTTGSRDMRI